MKQTLEYITLTVYVLSYFLGLNVDPEAFYFELDFLWLPLLSTKKIDCYVFKKWTPLPSKSFLVHYPH
jgi:hypothetical protein